jgi:hypothetical protein
VRAPDREKICDNACNDRRSDEKGHQASDASHLFSPYFAPNLIVARLTASRIRKPLIAEATGRIRACWRIPKLKVHWR